MSSSTVTLLQYPNSPGTPPPPPYPPFNSGPNGVTFTVPGPQVPTEVLTTFTPPGTFTLTSKPCGDPNSPVTAHLSASWQSQNYVFVSASGTNLGFQEAVSSCPATLLVQAPIPNPPKSHGGGGVAVLIFLASALAWLLLRKLRRMRWSQRG
jgi:hypothetical protein